VTAWLVHGGYLMAERVKITAVSTTVEAFIETLSAAGDGHSLDQFVSTKFRG
jgi:hypothetical protein